MSKSKIIVIVLISIIVFILTALVVRGVSVERMPYTNAQLSEMLNQAEQDRMEAEKLYQELYIRLEAVKAQQEVVKIEQENIRTICYQQYAG